MLTRTVLSYFSPAGARGKLSVFIFHRVLPSLDPLNDDEPDAATFDELLKWIKSWFNVLPLDQAVVRLRSGALPARAAAITFDDGYEDNYSIALPLLQDHGLTATFFVATSFLDGGCMWNDVVMESVRHTKHNDLNLKSIGLGRYTMTSLPEKRSAVRSIIASVKYRPLTERQTLAKCVAEIADVEPPKNLMMTSSQVKQIRSAGMLVGAHTVSHPILAELDDDVALDEMVSSRLFLEHLLDEPVLLFAYPNGKLGVDYTVRHAELARKAGFEAAVSTSWGAADSCSDIFQIPRFTPWERNKPRFLLRMILNLRTNHP